MKGGKSTLSSRVEVIGRDRIVSERLSAKAPIRHLDLTLILAVLALSAIGSVAIYSATRSSLEQFGEDPAMRLKVHLAHIAIAAIVFGATLVFDYRQLRGFAPVLFVLVLLLLVTVLTPLGSVVSGAQRWINLGFFQVQPSELMKLVLVVALAALFTEDRGAPNVDRRLALAVAMTMGPAFLIFIQPDLGSLMVLPAVLFTILLVSGVRMRWLLALALSGIIFFILVLNLGLIRDYQVSRLTAFLDPQSDPDRAGYNLEQSLVAIASGGFDGKGLFQGTQTNLNYVPEQHTDFIFTAIGEEFGFLGSMVVLGLFTVLLWRALRISMIARDPFGTLLAAGIAGMLAFQAFVNIGMTVGIMPITGIPLPFVSYGGTSLLIGFAAIGFLMNIHMRRFA